MPVPFAALLALCVSAACTAETPTFTYKELNHGVASTADLTVVRSRDGYRVSICSTKGSERARQELLCDSTFATRQWHYQADPGTDIALRRNGGKIELSGTLHGKPVTKTLTIDSHPWYQIIPLGLQTVSQDSVGRSKFWAVSLEEPAVLKAGCFCVEGIANAPLPGHPETACRRFRVKIAGLLTQVWVGEYFLRQDDHTFVYFQGYSFGAKKPTGTIEALRR